MSSHTLRQKFHHLDRSSSAFHDQLSNVLYEEEFQKSVPNLQDSDLVWLVDYLNGALDVLDPASSCFRKCLRELRHICGTKMILPTSYAISPSLLNIAPRPVASGGSGDVYKGTLDGSEVCIKRVRIYAKDGPVKATKTLYQEAVVWKRLDHKNVVPLLGITLTPLQLISDWMPNGALTEYIESHPGADRLGLLSDVAEGLYFLHSCNIVHGDLKGPNVLVDDSGHARITDFGVTRVTQNLDSMRSASGDQGHTARWTAPEILNEEETYSKEADVFSFAMVMIEAFTGAVPFHNSIPAAAMLAIMRGERPPRPSHPALTDELWALTRHCWDQDPRVRPEISKALKVLNGTESLPTTPYLYGFGSSSTLIVRQRASFATLPGTATPQPPSLRHAGFTVSHLTAQIPSQRPNHGVNTLSPEHQGGNAWLHGASQAMIRDPLSDADHGHSGGQPSGRISQSRQSTGESEPASPMPVDPVAFDLKALQNGLVEHQIYGLPGGIGKSRTNPQNNLGASHDGHHQETSLHDGDGTGSRLDSSYTGGGALSRRVSGKEISGANGYTAGNASHPDLQTGTKSRHQSRQNLNEPHNNDQEPPHGQKNHTEQSNPRANGGSQDSQEQEAESPSEKTSDHSTAEPNPPKKKHGVWCRLRKALCFA